jgi:hypothetical protein
MQFPFSGNRRVAPGWLAPIAQHEVCRAVHCLGALPRAGAAMVSNQMMKEGASWALIRVLLIST